MIIELSMGIIMMHAGNGWFVVGGGTGGVEYSVLLIVSFLFLAFTHSGKKNGKGIYWNLKNAQEYSYEISYRHSTKFLRNISY